MDTPQDLPTLDTSTTVPTTNRPGSSIRMPRQDSLQNRPLKDGSKLMSSDPFITRQFPKLTRTQETNEHHAHNAHRIDAKNHPSLTILDHHSHHPHQSTASETEIPKQPHPTPEAAPVPVKEFQLPIDIMNPQLAPSPRSVAPEAPKLPSTTAPPRPQLPESEPPPRPKGRPDSLTPEIAAESKSKLYSRNPSSQSFEISTWRNSRDEEPVSGDIKKDKLDHKSHHSSQKFSSVIEEKEKKELEHPVITEEIFYSTIWIYPEFTLDFTVHSARRDKIVYEFFTTEKTYVKNLEITIQLWKPHVLEAIQDKEIKKQFETVFSSMNNILGVNTELFGQLLQKMQTWSSTQTLGDVISALTPYLKMYQLHPSTYDDIVTILTEIESKEKEKKLIATLAHLSQHPLAEKKSLASFLILPVQRIPRYVLLLADLIKNTEETHPDYGNLSSSLTRMKEVADSINLAMKNAEMRRKMIQVQELIEDIQIIEAYRNFVLEGVLLKQCRKERQKRYDIMIIGKGSPGSKIEDARVLQLDSTQVHDVPDSAHTENAFQVQSPGKSFLAIAESPKEKAEWLTAIQECIKEELQRQAAHNKTVKTTEVAPVWDPDDTYKNCPLCSREFTVIFRKHHCRKCGTVACGECSKQKMLVPGVKDKKVRVCEKCYEARNECEGEDKEGDDSKKRKKEKKEKEKEKGEKKDKEKKEKGEKKDKGDKKSKREEKEVKDC